MLSDKILNFYWHPDIFYKKLWKEGKVDPIRDANQCQHGRDAHAPLAFVSHKLSFQRRISEFSESKKTRPADRTRFFLWWEIY